MVESHDMLTFGATMERIYKNKGGFTQEDRNNLLEAFNLAGAKCIEIAGELLDDTDSTLEWVTTRKIQYLNSAVSMLESAREMLVYHAIMTRGGDMVLADIADQLKEVNKGDQTTMRKGWEA